MVTERWTGVVVEVPVPPKVDDVVVGQRFLCSLPFF